MRVAPSYNCVAVLGTHMVHDSVYGHSNSDNMFQ